MLGRSLKGGGHLVGEVAAVVLAAKRPLHVLERRGVITPGKCDALDLQRAAVRADAPSIDNYDSIVAHRTAPGGWIVRKMIPPPRRDFFAFSPFK